jgi:hypothetical protein
MFCVQCGAGMPQNHAQCTQCGWIDTAIAQLSSAQLGPAQQYPRVPMAQAVPTKPDLAMRMLLPVGRSPYAIAAGYLGLISLLMLPAPLALLFGILGVRDIQKNPEKTGMGRAIFGIVMGAIFSIPLALLAVGGIAQLAFK